MDASQRLRIGTYQVRLSNTLREAGVFFDPEALNSDELDLIKAHSQVRGWKVRTRAEFVDRVFYRVLRDLGGLCLGFNVPFDVSRIAVSHEAAKDRYGTMRGGFSFRLSDDPRNPRVQIKRIGSRAAFIRFAVPSGRHPERRNRERGGSQRNFRGYFVDVATLANALLSLKGTLGTLAEVLQTEHRKSEARHGLEISAPYLDYAMGDVQVTWECFQILRARYETYGLTGTPLWQVYSEASIGKAHLRTMGVRPWRKVQPRFPHRVMATILETYYGGRTECRIRRVPVAGVYLDFKAQYATSFVLQEMWAFLIAKDLRWREEDPGHVQRLLDRVRPRDVLHPAFWRELHALVLVEPDGDRLPTRARYGGPQTPWNVAVSARSGGPAQWWTLADCVSSKLHTGKAPKVLRVLRFSAGEAQHGLTPIQIAGDPRFVVDPYRDDPIKRLVELRATVRSEAKQAQDAGDEARADELDAIQQGMKIAANAVYGIGIEINVVEHHRRAWATIYRPDGTSYRNRFSRTENLGSYFHPFIATLVSAGGRLLLATAMAMLEAEDGGYLLCDTDSLFVAATKSGRAPDEDQIPYLDWGRVLTKIVEPFESLNPYERRLLPGSILKIEDENFDDDGTQREIWALALASKRYALYTRENADVVDIIGRPGKRHRSEHGLGHLLPPGNPNPQSMDRFWIDEWWNRILALELGLPVPEFDWFSQPAAGRLPVSSRREEAAFRRYNGLRAYQDRVRPFNFLMTFHPHRLARERGGRALVAPFESDRSSWSTLEVIDRSSGLTFLFQTEDPEFVIPGRIPVQTYGDYFEEYRAHPESKLADADGAPCHQWSQGILQPRHIRAATVVRIGKESSRLTEGQELSEDEGQAAGYGELRRCLECGKQLADPRAKYCKAACKQRAYRRRRKSGFPL